MENRESNRKARNLQTLYSELWRFNYDNDETSRVFKDQSQAFLEAPNQWLLEHKQAKDVATRSLFRIFKAYQTKFDSKGFPRCHMEYWQEQDMESRIAEVPLDAKQTTETTKNKKFFVMFAEEDTPIIGIARVQMGNKTNDLEDVWLQPGYENFGRSLIDDILSKGTLECVTENETIVKMLLGHGPMTIRLEQN